jgi:hypothetical protein
MNANDSLERGIADVYNAEAPQRAPDWVLATALETIESTPQRRALIRSPWRFPDMNNTFAKMAIAAVAVVAIGFVGLNMLSSRGSSNVGVQPTATPSGSASPSPSPSPTLDTRTLVPPALTQSFASTVNGISTSYPNGWKAAAATQTWAGGGLSFISPDIDYLYDPVLTSDLFIAIGSQALAGKTGERWVNDHMADPESDCSVAGSEPITVDGATGLLCDTQIAVSTGRRGFFIRLYTSSDNMSVVNAYDQDWFRTVLATVQIDSTKAVDTAPSPAAS